MSGEAREPLRRFRVTTWPEGFTVEARDEEHAIVEAQQAIIEDGYLLAPVEVDPS